MGYTSLRMCHFEDSKNLQSFKLVLQSIYGPTSLAGQFWWMEGTRSMDCSYILFFFSWQIKPSLSKHIIWLVQFIWFT